MIVTALEELAWDLGFATWRSSRRSLMLEIHIVSLEQPVEHVLQHLGVHTWREREARSASEIACHLGFDPRHSQFICNPI